jgi:DNA-3-methyladenine glycosylase II
MTAPTAIRCEADIRDGVTALRDACSAFRGMHDQAGDPPVRIRPGGFDGLGRIIVGQQLSVASAAAIWARCQKTLKPFTADRINRAREATLRKAGLSAPKIRTLKAVSSAVLDGALDLDTVPGSAAEDMALREALVDVKGIGPWTADIYLMFCVGRPDVFAPGDLALQIGAQMGFGLDQRPTPEELNDLVAHWSPWRAVGARMLWHYYGHAKTQKAAVPV